MLSIDEFCVRHYACYEGRVWTTGNCSDMLDAWHNLKPEWLLWVASRKKVLSYEDAVKFLTWCKARDNFNCQFIGGLVESGIQNRVYIHDTIYLASNHLCINKGVQWHNKFYSKTLLGSSKYLEGRRLELEEHALWLRKYVTPNFEE